MRVTSFRVSLGSSGTPKLRRSPKELVVDYPYPHIYQVERMDRQGGGEVVHVESVETTERTRGVTLTRFQGGTLKRPMVCHRRTRVKDKGMVKKVPVKTIPNRRRNGIRVELNIEGIRGAQYPPKIVLG